jgi:hypothetical protein
MENEEVKEENRDESKEVLAVTCIRCGKPMEYGICDCNELVYVYWEM